MKNVFSEKRSLSHTCFLFDASIFNMFESNKNEMIKHADFLRTNFVIAIEFLSFIIVVKVNVSIIVFKKSLKQMKNEACQVLESFLSNIVSFLKE